MIIAPRLRLSTGRNGQYSWFNCPPCPSGACKMYIPGYLGSITCPDASVFCGQEEITGKLYTITDVILQWIILSVVSFVVITLLVMCCCWQKFRRWWSYHVQYCCGFELKAGQLDRTKTFQNFKQLEETAEVLHGAQVGCCWKCLQKILLLTNVIWLLLGTGLFGLGSVTAAGMKIAAIVRPHQSNLAGPEVCLVVMNDTILAVKFTNKCCDYPLCDLPWVYTLVRESTETTE